MCRVTDRRVAAGVEETLVTVVPANAIVLAGHVAQHLEDLCDALGFADTMPRDHDEIADLRCVAPVHDASFESGTVSMRVRRRRGHRGKY